MSEHPTKTRTESSTRRAKAPAPDFYELDTAAPRLRPIDVYDIEADAIRALAHPKRLFIVDLLSDGGERSVGELQEGTGMSQSNISQNLAILRTAGLLTARRDGNNVLYSVSDPRVLKAVTLLRAVLDRQIEDTDFLAEPQTAKAKERAKNASILGLVIGFGLLASTFAGAASMPLFMGGDLGDVADDAGMMLAEPTLDNLISTCREVISEPLAVAPAETSSPPA